MERLLKRAGIGQLPLKDSFTAIKIHFGEPGNLAYIRPNYAARMANLLRKMCIRDRPYLACKVVHGDAEFFGQQLFGIFDT